MRALDCYSLTKNDADHQRVNELAEQALALSRNAIALHLRLLCPALSMTKNKIEEGTLHTDGEYLAYNPAYILSLFRKDSAELTRSYLHTLLHCVFRHTYVVPWIQPQYWDLACDIAVENVITSLGIWDFSCTREYGQKPFISELQKALDGLTAEKIYAYMVDNPISNRRLKELKKHFAADDHIHWYRQEEKSEEESEAEQNEEQTVGLLGHRSGSSSEEDSDGDDATDANDEEGSPGNKQFPKLAEKTGKDRNFPGAKLKGKITLCATNKTEKAQREKIWERIAKQIIAELEVFSKIQGDVAGDLLQNLTEIKREKHDYTEFLKKFAVRCEVQKINTEEFDYIPYTYGLNRYGNMPLVEPLEYADCKRIKDFVIAIDTSGSTQGDVVQAFVQKTYNILKSTESFYKRVNIHIIQCDVQIQKDDTIRSLQELDTYVRNLKIYGLGGTDFRPVFRYVERLQKEKKLRNLKGLIYLTDGFGEYPERRPNYTTAFVFIKETFHDTSEVPPWAIKLELSKEEL